MIKSPYNIAPDASFRAAACVALRTQMDEMLKNLPGTRDGEVEALHDMRVASRRLRAAMSVFASAFAEQKFRPIEKEAARVTDALGAVRDADVQIAYLTEVRDNAPTAEKVGLDALLEHLGREREKERNLLIKEVDRLSQSRFWQDFDRMVTAVDSGEDGRDDG